MDFDFGTSEPQKEENNNNEINTSEPINQNNDGFINMDFQTIQFGKCFEEVELQIDGIAYP